MTLRFTAEQAFDCAAEGEPIMVDTISAKGLCYTHGTKLGRIPLLTTMAKNSTAQTGF